MKTITVDFTNCKSYLQIHLYLKENFGFPDYYRKNLDALWDCMRDFCYSPARILVKGIETLPEDLKGYAKEVLKVFDDLQEENEEIIIEVMP